MTNGLPNPAWLKSDNTYKIGRGVYSLPVDGNDVSPVIKQEVTKIKS